MLRTANYGLQLLLTAASELAYHRVVHGRSKLLISASSLAAGSWVDLELRGEQESVIVRRNLLIQVALSTDNAVLKPARVDRVAAHVAAVLIRVGCGGAEATAGRPCRTRRIPRRLVVHVGDLLDPLLARVLRWLELGQGADLLA